jgi:hypothetical protein
MSDKDRLLAEWKEIQQMEFWKLYTARIQKEMENVMLQLATGVRSPHFYVRGVRLIELQGKIDGIKLAVNIFDRIAKGVEEIKEEK